MVTALTVTNYVGETIRFDLMDPESSGFAITNITGITPVQADINITNVTTADGGVYNSARIDRRNIVITAVYLPGPTIEAARHKLYKYFPTKKKVKLVIETETRKLKTEGYVESNDVKIFTSQEFSQISIICPDPYFYSAEDVGADSLTFSGIEPNFEFPFYSDSSVDPEELIEFSRIEIVTGRTLTYTGDIEIGAVITVRVFDNIGDLVITNYSNSQIMLLSSARVADIAEEGFRGGDIITINTKKGSKSIIMSRGSKTYNLLNALDRKSKWITVVRGDNIFNVLAYDADNDSEFSTDISVSIVVDIAYEGV